MCVDAQKSISSRRDSVGVRAMRSISAAAACVCVCCHCRRGAQHCLYLCISILIARCTTRSIHKQHRSPAKAIIPECLPWAGINKTAKHVSRSLSLSLFGIIISAISAAARREAWECIRSARKYLARISRRLGPAKEAPEKEWIEIRSALLWIETQTCQMRSNGKEIQLFIHFSPNLTSHFFFLIRKEKKSYIYQFALTYFRSSTLSSCVVRVRKQNFIHKNWMNFIYTRREMGKWRRDISNICEKIKCSWMVAIADRKRTYLRIFFTDEHILELHSNTSHLSR